MLRGEREGRTVWSANQGPYWSVSVFVSILVRDEAKHVLHTLTHRLTRTNIQTQHGVQMYQRRGRPTRKWHHGSCLASNTSDFSIIRYTVRVGEQKYVLEGEADDRGSVDI